MIELSTPRMNPPSTPHGRGTGLNPANRFESLACDRDPDWDRSGDRPVRTEFFRDLSQTVIRTGAGAVNPGAARTLNRTGFRVRR
jgi:hypothetical protein